MKSAWPWLLRALSMSTAVAWKVTPNDMASAGKIIVTAKVAVRFTAPTSTNCSGSNDNSVYASKAIGRSRVRGRAMPC